jgi:hypothetical protein
MRRESHVRICERLGVKLPGSTQQHRISGAVSSSVAREFIGDGVAVKWTGQCATRPFFGTVRLNSRYVYVPNRYRYASIRRGRWHTPFVLTLKPLTHENFEGSPWQLVGQHVGSPYRRRIGQQFVYAS